VPRQPAQARPALGPAPTSLHKCRAPYRREWRRGTPRTRWKPFTPLAPAARTDGGGKPVARLPAGLARSGRLRAHPDHVRRARRAATGRRGRRTTGGQVVRSAKDEEAIEFPTPLAARGAIITHASSGRSGGPLRTTGRAAAALWWEAVSFPIPGGRLSPDKPEGFSGNRQSVSIRSAVFALATGEPRPPSDRRPECHHDRRGVSHGQWLLAPVPRVAESFVRK
jgi:hypothetical protein